MQPTANRLRGLSESVIREMTRVADLHGAINLAQGYPDFDPPQELIEAAQRALAGGYNQYSVTWGSPRFREALARKAAGFMGLELDPDEHITVTCGSTEAMMVAVMTVCDPGDKVVLFSPVYENYLPDLRLAGAEPVFVDLQGPQYRFDPQQLEGAFRQGAKALILCNPSNPTGKVFQLEELEIIADLALRHGAYVITDEVYEHIVYPPHQHRYLAGLPDMFPRTLSCGSLSKTYAITGWRLGYLIAAPEISREARKVHDFLTVGAPAPLQEAAVTALEFPAAYYKRLQEAYLSRRDHFLGFLEEAELSFNLPQGAYYTMVDIKDFDAHDDVEFCRWLAQEVGVAAVPGSSFYPKGSPASPWVRLNFAKRVDTLEQAGQRLLRLRRHP